MRARASPPAAEIGAETRACVCGQTGVAEVREEVRMAERRRHAVLDGLPRLVPAAHELIIIPRLCVAHNRAMQAATTTSARMRNGHPSKRALAVRAAVPRELQWLTLDPMAPCACLCA